MSFLCIKYFEEKNTIELCFCHVKLLGKNNTIETITYKLPKRLRNYYTHELI